MDAEFEVAVTCRQEAFQALLAGQKQAKNVFLEAFLNGCVHGNCWMFLGLYTKTMVHRIWRFTLVKSKMVKPLDTAKDIYWRFGEPNKLSAILIEGLKFWRFGVKRWVNWVFERAVNCAC